MRSSIQLVKSHSLKLICTLFFIGFQLILIAPATAQNGDDLVVVSFTLVNADLGEPIAEFDPIALDAIIDLDTLPTLNLNIIANVNGDTIGSVTFDLNGQQDVALDNFAPFTFAGDTNGTFHNWTPAQGNYILTAFPFAQSDGNGKIGEGAILRFSVVGSAENLPPSVSIFSDAVMTLPTNSTVLNGAANDPDGNNDNMTILWSMQDAPLGANLPKMSGVNSVSLLLEDLIEGTYRFRLNVIDENGLGNFADTFVYVYPVLDQPPIVDAGDSLELSLPQRAGTLYGSAYDDGQIVRYEWEQLDGPVDVLMNGMVGPTLQVSSMSQVGHYWFQLTVTDNSGQTASDDVTISINPDPSNSPPIITVSEDITLNMPQNSATLTSTFLDPDGWLDTLEWYKVSGPAATITPSDELIVTVSNLTAGAYVFRLNGYDNSGNMSFDTVHILVNPEPNDDPVLTVDNNITLNYPETEVTIQAEASDDGTIEAWVWIQDSGPAGATLWDTDTAALRLTNLPEGEHQFKVTVFDNNGAKSSQFVSVTMIGSAPPTATPQPTRVPATPTPVAALTIVDEPEAPSVVQPVEVLPSSENNLPMRVLGSTDDEADGYYLSLLLACILLMGAARWNLFRPKKINLKELLKALSHSQ